MSIVIVGAYGFDNVGDEAMLYVVLRNLQSVLPNETRVVSCVDQNMVKRLHNVATICSISPLSCFKNLLQLRLGNFREQLKVISRMKMLVYGGGSLFTDSKGIKNISVILMTVMMARIMKIPVIIWGVSVGPINSRIGSKIVKTILQLATLVIVRDKKSIAESDQLGIKHIEIRQGADLLFHLLRWNDIDRNVSYEVKVPLQIGVSLRPFPGTLGTDYIFKDEVLVAGVVKAFRLLMQQKSIQITGLIFSKGPERRDDLGIINKVKKELPSELFKQNVGGLSDGGENAESIISRMLIEIANLDVVIGERFHSLVTAALMGIPFIAISYDPKVRELVKISGMADYCIDFEENINELELSEAINSMMERLLKNYSQIKVSLSKNIKEIEQIAEQDSIYVLDKLDSLSLR